MKRTWTLLLSLGAALWASAWTGDAVHAQVLSQTGDLYFVHGLPGLDLGLQANLPVDVCIGLNGTGTTTCFYAGVQFGEIKGPLELSPGGYQVQVSPANPNNPGTNPPLLTASVFIQRGQSFSVVANLDPNGAAQLNVFQNDVARIGLTQARVVVRHGAAQGPVNVTLTSLIGLPGLSVTNVANGDESAVTNLTSGPYLARLRATGTAVDLIGPTNLLLQPVTANHIYVVGSTEFGTMRLLVHSFKLRPKLLP